MTNLEKWRFYLDDLESPDVFINWTLPWAVSSALQRRVYYGSLKAPIFPNIYVVFVADPGIGKSIAARIAGSHILKTFYTTKKEVLDPQTGAPMQIPAISFSADCTTYESLIQQLGMAIRGYEQTRTTENGLRIKVPASHNSMCLLLSEELTTLFRTNMDDISGALNQWWDAQDFHYKIKHGPEDNIKNVCVSLLGCTTPDNVAKLMKLGVLDQGLTARAIFIYGDIQRKRTHRYNFTEEQVARFEEVRSHIKHLLTLEGEIDFTPEADAWFKDYYESGKLQGEICNKDRRLQHYSGRIKVHVVKLAIALHFMENHTMGKAITLATVQQAVAMLRAVEPLMHKALASNAKNELFDSAMKMMEYLRSNNSKASKIQLRLRFGDVLNMKQFDECLDYLKMTGQVVESFPAGETKLMVMIKQDGGKS